MKEILFRGKRVYSDKWVYGYYKYSKILNEHIIVGDDDWVSCTVIPETIGQYTGLDDKNGKKIYEGDVLQNVGNPHVDKLLFKVIWSKHYGAWFWWALEGELRMDYLGQSIAEDCEVIGNIYDNPELMGEK